MIFKYIITNEGAIIFPNSVTHKTVAGGFIKIYSAGFCKVIFDGEIKVVEAYGNSISLNIGSIPTRDLVMLNWFFSSGSPLTYHLITIEEVYGGRPIEKDFGLDLHLKLMNTIGKNKQPKG